jgi:hypothetical protein
VIVVAIPLPIYYNLLMKRHYNKYTNKDIVTAIAEVKSMSGLLKKLGLKPAGGNFANMKAKLQYLQLSCSHWTGQAWNKNQQLKDWKDYKKVECLKLHLINLRGRACEICKLTHWQNVLISLEVHHKDGDRTHNELDNLQLLCPNCHSYTDHYRNRKRE